MLYQVGGWHKGLLPSFGLIWVAEVNLTFLTWGNYEIFPVQSEGPTENSETRARAKGPGKDSW